MPNTCISLCCIGGCTLGVPWFLALLLGPAEFQAIFMQDCKVCSGDQGSCGGRDQLLIIELCSVSGCTWLIKECAHSLFISRHIPWGEFSPQALCAYMNIATVYLKTLRLLIKVFGALIKCCKASSFI